MPCPFKTEGTLAFYRFFFFIILNRHWFFRMILVSFPIGFPPAFCCLPTSSPLLLYRFSFYLYSDFPLHFQCFGILILPSHRLLPPKIKDPCPCCYLTHRWSVLAETGPFLCTRYLCESVCSIIDCKWTRLADSTYLVNIYCTVQTSCNHDL